LKDQAAHEPNVDIAETPAADARDPGRAENLQLANMEHPLSRKDCDWKRSSTYCIRHIRLASS
jgi:hypothetical protein